MSSNSVRQRQAMWLGIAVLFGLVLWPRMPAGVQNWVRTFIAPGNAAEFWTMATAVTTFALAVVAYRGLNSLGLAKSDMLTRAQRESRQSAVTRCEEFAGIIIPLSTRVVNGLAANKVQLFVKAASDIGFDPDNKDHVQAAGRWFGALPAELRGEIIVLLNRMEAWAMYFTHRLADPKIAFGPCAPYFCTLVVQCYPVLLFMRSQDAASGKYPNVVKLFKGWLEDLEEQKRGIERGDLLRKLEALQREGTPSAKLPPPLGLEGTDVDG